MPARPTPAGVPSPVEPSSNPPARGRVWSAAGQAAEAAFWATVAARGGRPAPGATYRRAKVPVALICERGHSCAPRPVDVRQGGGLCRTCAGKDPLAAEAAFRASVTAAGSRFAPGATYRSTRMAVSLICKEGHTRDRIPCQVRDGGRICDACPRPVRKPQGPRNTKGRTQAQIRRGAESKFWAAVAALGAKAAPGARYLNSKTPVALICVKGHECGPRPATVNHGQGVCRTCGGSDTHAAEATFLALVAEAGAQLAPGAAYTGSLTPVDVICKEGHSCRPTPNNARNGHALCRRCAGLDPQAAEEEFWERVAAHGAKAAPGATYRNTQTPVALICKEGHACSPLPGSLKRGQGVCEPCEVLFDRVYLLAHDEAGAIKVGIASNDARVNTHLPRGYRLLAQWRGLGHDTARQTERAVLGSWREQGHAQVDACPKDGRTETAPARVLAQTLAHLHDLLGAPTS